MSDILDFIDNSPSPFHAVDTIRASLEEKGFTQLYEDNVWELSAGQNYFTIRGGKSIIAWTCGTKAVDQGGFHIIAAHTDSPVLKVKQNPHLDDAEKRLLKSDVYGSPLLYTWLDRDLKLCGQIYYKQGDTGAIKNKRIDLSKTPVRATSLAIHLSRGLRDNGLVINPQTDMHLFFADANHTDSTLIDVLSADTDIDVTNIVGFDLCGADLTPSAYTGVDGQFISAPRLDNLFSCYCALESLLASQASSHDHTNVGVWFDAEEIGSLTSLGARSNFLDTVLNRIVLSHSKATTQSFDIAKAKSYMISADMAHAEHPSFKQRTDEQHVPYLNKGLAVKSSANSNYADCGPLVAWLESTCKDHDIPLQRFMYRCDHGGGASVGPLVSSSTGINTIDVGSPMLAMHSIRELGGRQDVDLTIKAFNLFYGQKIEIDTFR